MARTIGTQLRGELNQEFADLREMDNVLERELERTPGDSRERRDSRPEPYLRIRGERVPNPAFIAMFPDAARDTFGFDVPAMEQIVNDDNIILTPEMVEIINDPMMRMTRNGEITRRTGRDVIRRSGQFARSAILPDLPSSQTRKRKKTRKPSKYQRELGRQLKMLKKKHPRTKIVNLMKRAHRATKKSLKR
tara:strand:- start:768 stop:1343 length:576 start_codon:yes stop_codon:yes gene_type:complete